MDTDIRGPHRLTRRDFGRLAAGAGAAAALATALKPEPASATPSGDTSASWEWVREQFLMPPDLAVMNAANLCPSPAPVLESLYAQTREIDRDPSPMNRVKMAEGQEAARRRIAEFLHVSAEEIVITRNTSEANNLVSSGLDLRAGDEVVLFSDNHPSNLVAWREKAKRFGYEVKVIDQVHPHPGPEQPLEAFVRAATARTRVLGFSHLTNTVGDLFPARELCRAARDRGILTLVDGAQSFGLLDLDLGEMRPDFFTASAHKWACGPRETGLLYVARSAQPRIRPSIVSHHPGAVGISKTFEAFGQRDEAAMIAFGEALGFQSRIGRPRIEKRARELAQALMEGLRNIDGTRLWTHPDPQRSVAVVSLLPGSLDPARLAAALYERDRIGCAVRTTNDRPGLRFSPHLYNSHAEVERVVAALKRYLATGV